MEEGLFWSSSPPGLLITLSVHRYSQDMSDCVVCNASNLAITTWALSACVVFRAVALSQVDSLSAPSVVAAVARVVMAVLQKKRRRKRQMLLSTSQPKKISKRSCLMARMAILLPQARPLLLLPHRPQRQLPLLLPLHNSLICTCSNAGRLRDPFSSLSIVMHCSCSRN